MTEQNGEHKKRSMIVRIKKVLSPILHEKSLRNLNVNGFINILYPIGLSLVLAFIVDQISKSHWPDNYLIFALILAVRILITSLLILYMLFDWDDCHYAAQNKKQNTAYDVILWLLAIFCLSLVTVLFLSFSAIESAIENLTIALVSWLAYVIATSSLRDTIIERKTTTNNGTGAPYKKLTQTKEYGAYNAYRNTSIIIWSIMFFALLFYMFSRKCIGENIDWNPSAKTIGFLSGLECSIIHICFVVSVLHAVWLKEKRKKLLFLGSDNSHQAEEEEV